MNTPKALANWSPGFEHRENPGSFTGNPSNPERVRQLANVFSVPDLFQSRTHGCRYAPTAGLKLANAFGVNSNRGTTLSLVGAGRRTRGARVQGLKTGKPGGC